METRTRNIIIGTVSALIAGALIYTGVVIYRNRRQAKYAHEVDELMDLAVKEGRLNDAQVDNIRFIFDIKNYQLPKEYKKAWDDNLTLIRRARKELGNADFNAYGKTLNEIRSRIPSNIRPDFETAFNLVKETISLTGAMRDDADSLAVSLADSAGMVLNVGKYLSPAIWMFGGGLQKSLDEKAAIRNNPKYILMKNLYTGKYTKNQLKLFDMMWEVFSGKPFFITDTSNVKP